MADLYGSNESEDMSSFLQILLNNNSSSSAATTDNIPASAAFFTTGCAPETSSGINFSDPSCFFAKEDDSNSAINLASSFEGSEASELPVDLAAPRSSKRCRAAEFHNLSEKRRRSRINEKLKALQKLIPNSNKTDKASMLDEAIEYLKQLQLQVQMLTMRNGLSLHPGYSVGSMQSMLVPPIELNEGNLLLNENRGTNTISTGQDVFMQTALQTSNHGPSSQLMRMPSLTSSSEILPNFLPISQNHYGLLNHLAASKEICREDTLSRLQLDISCSGNNSSPG